MELENFDFSAITNVGVSIDEMVEAFILLSQGLGSKAEWLQPSIITAPDGIPLSDTEYAGLELGKWHHIG